MSGCHFKPWLNIKDLLGNYFLHPSQNMDGYRPHNCYTLLCLLPNTWLCILMILEAGLVCILHSLPQSRMKAQGTDSRWLCVLTQLNRCADPGGLVKTAHIITCPRCSLTGFAKPCARWLDCCRPVNGILILVPHSSSCHNSAAWLTDGRGLIPLVVVCYSRWRFRCSQLLHSIQDNCNWLQRPTSLYFHVLPRLFAVLFYFFQSVLADSPFKLKHWLKLRGWMLLFSLTMNTGDCVTLVVVHVHLYFEKRKAWSHQFLTWQNLLCNVSNRFLCKHLGTVLAVPLDNMGPLQIVYRRCRITMIT